MILRFVLAFFLALGLFSVAPVAPTASTLSEAKTLEQQHATAHRIGVYGMLDNNEKFKGEIGHCSATAIGPHALLTAQHCFEDSNLVRLDADKEPTVIVAAFLDGNDHVIYIVEKTFSVWASINERPLVVGEYVHLWGNPGKNSDVYRSGYFVKITTDKSVEKDEHFLFQLFMLPIFGGDSGSGLFDTNGYLVAVTSMADESDDSLDLPLAFTQSQLDVAVNIGTTVRDVPPPCPQGRVCAN